MLLSALHVVPGRSACGWRWARRRARGYFARHCRHLPEDIHICSRHKRISLTLYPVGIFCPRPRTDTERAAVVLRRGTGRGGPQSLPVADVFPGISGPRRGVRGGPRQRARTARVNVRATARTNGVKSAQATRSWDIQQAEKPIRVRNAGEKLRPRPRFGSTTSRVGPSHRPSAVTFSNGMWDCPPG